MAKTRDPLAPKKASDIVPAPKDSRYAGLIRVFPSEIQGEVLALFECGMSLDDVCRTSGIHPAAILKHVSGDEEFAEQYAKSRAIGRDINFERLLKEFGNTDDCPEVIKAHGPALANWLRSRVDTIKWCLSKMEPKKYGESSLLKLTDHTGNAPAQITIAVVGMSTAEAQALISPRPAPPMLEAETIPDAEFEDVKNGEDS